MGLIATILVGLVAGWLAHLVMKTNTSIWIDLVLGVVGGFLGGWLTGLIMHVNLMSGFNLTSIIVALVGAIIVIAIYRFFTRGRK